MRKALKITGFVVTALVTLIIAGILAMQTSPVQTFLAKKYLASIHDRFGGTIQFERVHVNLFNALVLKNIVILDDHPYSDPSCPGLEKVDTLLRARYLVATFSIKGLRHKEGLHIHKAYLSDAVFNLTIEDGAKGSPYNTASGSTMNLRRIFKMVSGPQKPKNMGNIFDADRIDVRNFEFRLINFRSQTAMAEAGIPPKARGIRWNDLDVVCSLKGHRLRMTKGVMSGIADSFSLKEKSGLNIHDLTGKVKVGCGKTILEDLHWVDALSDLNIPRFTLSYKGTSDFGDFIEKVRMTGKINQSHLNLKSMGYFAPVLLDRGFNAMISGSLDGYVNDLSVKNVKLHDLGSGVDGTITGSIIGIPSVRTMLLDYKFKDLEFTSDGLGKFIREWAPRAKLDLSKYAKGKTFTFNGTGKGPLNKLIIDGKVGSDIGSLAARLDIRNLIDSTRATQMGGKISTKDLDIGKIIGSDLVHECSLRTSASVILKKGSPEARIDTAFVDRLNIKGYNYSNIAAAGTFSNHAFDGKIICNDPNLNFLFQGIFTLSNKTRNGIYRFYANLGYADLQALNLDKRGLSKVSLRTNANYIRISKGDIIGNVDIQDIVLENEHGRHNIGTVSIASHSNDDVHRVKFSSSFADGTFVGSKPMMSIFSDIEEVTLRKELPALFKKQTITSDHPDYDLSMRFHDSRDLLSFVMPGLYIADSTALKLKLTDQGALNATITSPRIAFKDKYMKGLSVKLDNADESLRGTFTSQSMNISSIEFRNNIFRLFADDNHVGVGYVYDDETEPTNKGEIYVTGDLSRSASDSLYLKAQTRNSNVYYNGDGWNINPSDIIVTSDGFSVDNLLAECGDQSININGGLSKHHKETLTMDLHKFNIDILNQFFNQGLDIQGLATGRAVITSPTATSLGLIADLSSDSTSVAGIPVGTLLAKSRWDEDNSRFNFNIKNEMAGISNIDILGHIYPKIKRLDATADLDQFNLGYAEPFLSSVFSHASGKLYGQIKMSGPFNNLSISSSGTRIEDGHLTVDFTKVPYIVNGPFSLDENGLVFDKVQMKDRYTGTGTIQGGIYFDHFKNFRLDTKLKVNQMEFLNMTWKDNRSFYGNIFGTGTVDIAGPFNAIRMNVNATTVKDGHLNIPLNSSTSANQKDLLTFKENEKYSYIDPYDLMMNKITAATKSKNDFGINLKINATPDVEALIEIDKTTGNVLRGRGNGLIELEVRPRSEVFNINGDYNITSGNYHFVAMGIAQRDFTIQDGSSVTFNGDIAESNLNINALYKTKTTLATLLADTSSVTTRSLVECGISITDKLKNPNLKFSINIPDLDPTTQARVQSALNTDDKIQKQFLSLVISNSFLPTEQSGIVNNTSNVLFSNVAEIMSNQLNNILQKLDIPLDLGLSYQSTERGNDVFDVAVSTQLFNNRVVVNGTIGNRQYNTSGTNEDVVGDLDIEVKLNKPGTFRMNLFSHAADQYTNYLDNSQRNGVGLAYQKEFNTLGQFVKGIFTPRKKQQAPMLPDQETPPQQETVTIKVQPKENSMSEKGKLYLIPSPLGDKDPSEVIPQPTLELLRGLHTFVVEEVRTIRRYLSRAGLKGHIDELQFYELNEHTQPQEVEAYLKLFDDGNDVGLITEAGLPAVADPGSQLVALCHREGIHVVPQVGPSSLMLALMASGLNGQVFAFCGYLPAKTEDRRKALKEVESRSASLNQTQIIIETPYRNDAFFQDILKTCQEKTRLCIAADLTMDDEFIRTMTVGQWRRETMVIGKRPCVFLLLSR
jgi:16S rRNA (cytidine(1402)-2'-O)-methyltransferase